MNKSTASLYRAYLRQIRQLPHIYLQQFYRIKASDDIRAIANSPVTNGLRNRKTKRVFKDVQRIKAALAGNHKSFAHVLDVAYGRKGKLHWELMEPFLADSDASLPSPIIPANPKSRPPVFSPELRALLTSCVSRDKPLKLSALNKPPLMSARADPNTEDARLLGPLSKRRHVNFIWRYFVSEWKKVNPPLHTTITPPYMHSSIETCGNSEAIKEGRFPRQVGFCGLDVYKELEGLARRAPETPPSTRRQSAHLARDESQSSNSIRLRSRWFRRRYQDLLSRIPILVHPGTANGAFSVSVSQSALNSSGRFKHEWLPEIDDADLEWLKLAEAANQANAMHNGRKSK